MSAQSTPIQAGTLLDALKKMFFDSITNIFDSAVEYRKEMGVLKQVNRIEVKDKDGQDHTIEVKLSPVKDKDGIFYVEIECETLPDLKKIDSINNQALRIDKNSKEDLKKIFKKILEDNNLMPVNDEDITSEDEDDYKQLGGVRKFHFYNDAEQPTTEEGEALEGQEGLETFTVRIRLLKKKSEKKYMMQVKSDPPTPVPFKETVQPSLAKLASILQTWQDDNELGIEDEDKEQYDAFLKLLSENSEDVESTTSIVRFQKITANGHSDVNLISIKGSITEDDLVDILNDSDELFDEIPEGESDYIIEDCDNVWIVNPLEF